MAFTTVSLIFLIGNSIPAVHALSTVTWARSAFRSSSTKGQEIFALHRICRKVFIQESPEPAPAARPEYSFVNSHVHGNNGGLRSSVQVAPSSLAYSAWLPCFSILVRSRISTSRLFCICPAYAPCHIPILCQGIVQLVAHHGILVVKSVSYRGQLGHISCERPFSIIIIRIDYRKGPSIKALQQSTAWPGAPRLYPALRHLVSIRNLIQLLVNIGHIHIFTDSVSNVNSKSSSMAFDNEYDFSTRFLASWKINDDIPRSVMGQSVLIRCNGFPCLPP